MIIDIGIIVLAGLLICNVGFWWYADRLQNDARRRNDAAQALGDALLKNAEAQREIINKAREELGI